MFVSLTRRWEKFDSMGSVRSCKHHACYWEITTIFSTFYSFCAFFKCWYGLNCLQNASVLFVWSCLFAWAWFLPVCRLQHVWSWLQFQWTKELEGKRDAFVRVSDKREAYTVWVRLREHDRRTGWNLSLVFQQNYSKPINNISVVEMDLEICWWPCLPKLRQPRATKQARMKSCSWIWGDTIKGSRMKLGRGSSCYVQFAS